MKFSKEEDYAILFISFLKKQANKYIGLSVFAQNYQLSPFFLKAIAKKLKKAGLIIAKEGRFGGYKLNRKNITLGDILKAVSENEDIIPCQTSCPCFNSCQAKSIWRSIEKSINKYLFQIKI